MGYAMFYGMSNYTGNTRPIPSLGPESTSCYPAQAKSTTVRADALNSGIIRYINLKGGISMYDPFNLDLIPIETLVAEIRDLEYLNNLPEYPNLQRQDIMEIVRYRNWILNGNYV